MDSNTFSNSGNLTLFIGPMFSGKTTKLLRVHNDVRFMKKINSNNNPKKDYLINFIKDNRYGRSTLIITHDGIKEECLAVENLSQLWNNEEFKENYESNNIENLFINEGQFFQDIFEFSLFILENSSINIFIAALDSDYLRNKFGNIWNLIPHAHTVDKLKGQCKFCNNNSIYTLKTTHDSQQTVIASDIYEPVCRNCYLKKNLS